MKQVGIPEVREYRPDTRSGAIVCTTDPSHTIWTKDIRAEDGKYKSFVIALEIGCVQCETKIKKMASCRFCGNEGKNHHERCPVICE